MLAGDSGRLPTLFTELHETMGDETTVLKRRMLSSMARAVLVLQARLHHERQPMAREP
jgi:hypothetical protein